MQFLGLAIAFGLMAAILWLGRHPGVTRLIGAPEPAAARRGELASMEGAGAEPHSFAQPMLAELGDPAAGSAVLIAIGFMLLASFLSGGLAHSFQLPKITGYLAVGVLVGPAVLGFISTPMISDMAVIKGLAVALIALNAGGELNFGWLRQKLREVLIILSTEGCIVLLAIAGALVLLSGYLGPIPLDQPGVKFSVMVIVFIVALSNSPMVAIALTNETRSQGPFSRMVLVVCVFKDILLVIAFTMALEICRTLTSDTALSAGAFAELLLVKVLGSIAFGALIGWVLAVYVRRVGREMPIVILTTCFFIALVGAQLHFKPLLVALATGCFIENFAKDAGHRVIEGIRRTSLPVYCLFFSLAGVELHLGLLRTLGPVVLTLALVRLGAIWAGCAIGTRLAGADPAIRKYVWTGLISQAGLSLALASIVGEAFEWGGSVQTLLIAMVVINEIIGPIIFNWALRRSGEAGRAAAAAKETGEFRSPTGPMPQTA